MSDHDDCVAVDWGTSRFRAFRSARRRGARPRVERRRHGERPRRRLEAVLERHCGPWMEARPHAPVLLVGMVGSRNGWAEAAYAAAALPRPAEHRRRHAPRWATAISIVCRASSHAVPAGADVMRGEETLVLRHRRRQDGLVCLPGTHSKWAEGGARRDRRLRHVHDRRELRRCSAATACSRASPPSPRISRASTTASRRPSDRAGLLNRLFQARARVLDGAMDGANVGPFLSGLLIGEEMRGALRASASAGTVTLVADGVLAAPLCRGAAGARRDDRDRRAGAGLRRGPRLAIAAEARL